MGAALENNVGFEAVHALQQSISARSANPEILFSRAQKLVTRGSTKRVIKVVANPNMSNQPEKRSPSIFTTAAV